MFVVADQNCRSNVSIGTKEFGNILDSKIYNRYEL